ncbi:hypothetical protein [Gaetbulibacter saemankumensis]|uniref:hypothetical protein n=1 Tax=Gaetbulibacter saemankumensis TaxID=311208 RepID=UPI00041909EE|nr:hypothetical protein [Gaetbulibacter saemankumensis]
MSVVLIPDEQFERLFRSGGISITEEEDHGDALPFSPAWSITKKTGRFHLLLKVQITEYQVGISENDINKFLVTWELINRQNINGITYCVFEGWGDPMSGGHKQFEGIKMGVNVSYLLGAIKALFQQNPEMLSISKLKNVIGFENIPFEKLF